MVKDLQNARELLSAALDRYITTCSAIIIDYDPSHALKSISQEISDTVNKELEVIASYHTKLTHAQTMVNRTMNYIPTLTPIHMLPSEILSYIFQLVRDAQPDYLDKDLSSYPQTYPETLTCVCSHWRQIAIDSRALWSHIQVSDSSYAGSDHARLLARARVFAARAGPSPVDVYIVRSSEYYYDNRLNDFLASVGTRIRSFDMSTPYCGSVGISIFNSWFKSCQTASLNELTLKHTTHYSNFEMIEASGVPTSSNSLFLDMSHELLEERLLPVKVLRLTGAYFRWASQAYHGLVELRLLPIRDGINLDISQSQLKAILTASPRLRELHFGLELTSVHSNASRAAVNLNDLELVNLCSMKWGGHYDPLLRLLAPGPKPLQLSMNCRLTTSTQFPGKAAMEFFARSNVTKLHIESVDPDSTGRYQPLVLLELLKHVPTLRALSLRCFYLGCNRPGGQPLNHEPSSHADGTELILRTPSELDIVNLRDCTVDLDYLRRVTQVVPIQKLNYKECRFYSMTDGSYNRSKDSQPQDSLPSAFSHVPSSWPLDELDPWG